MLVTKDVEKMGIQWCGNHPPIGHMASLTVNELLESSHVHRNTIIGNKNTNDEKKEVKKRDEVGKVGDLCEHLLE
jgi:hypothetical protein